MQRKIAYSHCANPFVLDVLDQGPIGKVGFICLKGMRKKPALKGEKMAKQEQKKPNILVIWGDDIGWSNLSCYNLGMMGIQNPEH
jgi:hypothetical protein